MSLEMYYETRCWRCNLNYGLADSECTYCGAKNLVPRVKSKALPAQEIRLHLCGDSEVTPVLRMLSAGMRGTVDFKKSYVSTTTIKYLVRSPKDFIDLDWLRGLELTLCRVYPSFAPEDNAQQIFDVIRSRLRKNKFNVRD
jgi:hypothetical protein